MKKCNIYSFDYLCRKYGVRCVKAHMKKYLIGTGVDVEAIKTKKDAYYWMSWVGTLTHEFAEWIEMQEEPSTMSVFEKIKE